MRQYLLPVLLATCFGCESRAPLIAEYGPERRYEMSDGVWLDGAKLDVPGAGRGSVSDLEQGTPVVIVAGDHAVVRFARKDDVCEVRIWVQMNGTSVVGGAMWAKEFGTESTWFLGSNALGSVTIDPVEGDDVEGTLEVRFDGMVKTARGGAVGPQTFRLKGPFRASRSKAR